MRTKKSKYNKTKSIITISTFVIVVLSLCYYFYLKHKKTNTFSHYSFSVKGIDISHHNPILDWSEIKSQGIIFAYIKSTEGITHDDRNYSNNYKQAKKNNIKVGSYHFYNFAISGREQARHFINTAKCESGDLFPAIDVEHSPANPYSKDSTFVSTTIKELKVLENELYKYYGVHPIIYTNADCYKLYVKDNFTDNPLWISSLNGEPNSKIENWIFWQFTHTGTLSGIVGDVDFNYFRYSLDRLNEISLP